MGETHFEEPLRRARESLARLAAHADALSAAPSAMRQALDDLGAAMCDLASAHGARGDLAADASLLAVYARLVHDAPNAIVLVDLDHRIALANTAYARLHQTTTEAITGVRLRDFIGEEHYATAATQLARVFAGETLEFTTWYDYPDGPRFMHVYYYPIRTDDRVEMAGVILTDTTGQAKYAEALRDSEERFRAFSEATTEGIVMHERGQIIQVNRAFADHLGYTPEEMLERSVLEFTAPESREAMVRHMLAGDPGPYTAISLHRDGSRTVGEIRARDITFHGRPVRVAAVRDITDLVQARTAVEDALHRSEAHTAELDAVISSIVDIATVTDMEGRVLRVNAAGQRLAGTALPASSTLCDVLNVFNVETVEGERMGPDHPVIRRVFGGATVQNFVVVVHLPDGRTLWLSTSAGPIRLADGRQIGAVFTASDITVQHVLQEEAQRRAAEMDATFAALADGLVVYDTGGTVIRVNDALVRMSGIPPEVMALPADEFLARVRMETPDGRAVRHDELPHVRALRGERVMGSVMVLHPEPGQAFWIAASAAPIRTPAGEVAGAVVTVTDITEVRLLQEERELYIHTISHDLRAPLAAVMGHADLLSDELAERGLDGDLVPSVAAIQRSAQRMHVMIQDLVDAARMEGGQLVLDRHPVDLADYLADLLVRTRSSLDTTRVHLDVTGDLPPVSADPNRLERILLNLISNALKYSYPGTPVVVHAYEHGDMVTVSVIDHGPGIAADDLPHLFTRFRRGRRAHQAEGIGLGLYTTRMLVEAHGGHVWAESEPGRGSVFSFTLPRAHADTPMLRAA